MPFPVVVRLGVNTWGVARQVGGERTYLQSGLREKPKLRMFFCPAYPSSLPLGTLISPGGTGFWIISQSVDCN